MKKSFTFLALLVAPVALFAGTTYKAPVIKNPVCAIPFTGTVSAGYESAYIFRGLDFGGDAPWFGIDTNWQLSNAVSLDLGVWYINPTDSRGGAGIAPNPALTDATNFVPATDELDLYATFNFALAMFDASLGVVHYYYPELSHGTSSVNGNRNTEVNMGLGYSLPWFDIAWLTAYDFTLNNGDGSWYHQFSASKSIALTDCLSLGMAAGLGLVDNYLHRDAFGGLYSGWSHAFATLGLTWAMTETAAFDIYVGGNFPNSDDIVNTRGDQLHGGASVSVSF